MANLGTRSLTITIGGTDYTSVVTNVRLVSGAADSDFVTFADAAAGGARQYTLAFTCAQDPAAGSLWDKAWASPGTTAAFVLKPAGGAAATAATPWFSGNATIVEPDGDFLGGEADASTTARFTTDFEWVCTAKPTRAVA